MPAWIEAITQTQVLVVLGTLIFLGWLAIRAWRPLAAFVRFLDEVIGRPDRPDRPSLLDRMAALEKKVETIHAEVTPNHGGSMKDALKRVEEGVEEARRLHEADAQRLADHLEVAERDSRRLDEVIEGLTEDEESP